MNTRNTRLHTVTRLGAVAALALGLLTARATPAAAQFPTLYGFGANAAGELGNGTGQNSATPTIVGCFSHCAALAASEDTTLMLALDGTVWSTGDNGRGQLGYKTSQAYMTYPQQIPGLNNVSSIAMGRAGVAVKSNGSVWAWGDNTYGVLANGAADPAPHPTPAQVMQYGTPLRPLLNIQAVSAGISHALALDNSGIIWTWGSNEEGQLGTGDGQNYPYAVVLLTLPNVKQVAAGYFHSLALRYDGTVWAWGENSSGELGDGTTTLRKTPVQVAGLSHVVAVAANGTYSLALKEDGTVWYWGYFYGYSPIPGTLLPTQIPGLNNIITIAGGLAHILAVDGNNNLWGVGDNSMGQLGDPTLGAYQQQPKQLTTFTAVTNIAAGEYYSVVETYASNMAGNVHLEGIRDNAAPQTLTLTFRAAGQPDIVRTTTVSADPFVEVDNLPRANYTLLIKGGKWLQRAVPLDLTAGNSYGLDVTLSAGDANGDNSVDVADFGVLINAYGGFASDPTSGYDVRADFNCDGMVDIADFALLVNNYGSVGDN